MLVEGLLTGICGTDIELVSAATSAPAAPARTNWSSATSRSAGCWKHRGSGFSAGDLVAGVVRRPGPSALPGLCPR